MMGEFVLNSLLSAPKNRLISLNSENVEINPVLPVTDYHGHSTEA